MKTAEIVVTTVIITIILLVIFLKSSGSIKGANYVPVVSRDAMDVVSIDGCEYIANHTYMGSVVYTHKGNCTNSIHIYNK